MKTWILIFLLIVAGSTLAFRTHSVSTPVVYVDTPKVQVIIIPIPSLVKTQDSIAAFVLSFVGKSLTVDQAQEVLSRNDKLWSNLYRVSKVDSVRVKPTK
jgi:hypothetical protein